MVSLDALQNLVPAVRPAQDVEAVVEDEAAHLRPGHKHTRVVAPVPGDLKDDIICVRQGDLFYFFRHNGTLAVPIFFSPSFRKF